MRLLLAALLLTACQPDYREALREDEQRDINLALASQKSSGHALSVDRVYAEHDYGYAVVTFRNTSQATFRNAVTIRCDAIGADGAKIGTNTRSFFARESGLAPGFESSIEVPVRLHGATLSRLECYVDRAF